MKFVSFFGMVLLFSLYGCATLPSPPEFSSLSRDRERPATPAQGKVIQTARSLVGTPYRYGGTTPQGFDCSGFIGYVYKKAARLSLPRTTEELARTGRPISPSELRPSDLVYFEIERKSLHAGIYIGNGKFIHAPSSKGKVNIQRLDLDYRKSRYLGARRIL
jgi:cell wall-associated NlpC family hydrolase